MRTPQDGDRATFLSLTTREGTMRFPIYQHPPPGCTSLQTSSRHPSASTHIPNPTFAYLHPIAPTVCLAGEGLLIPVTPL